MFCFTCTDSFTLGRQCSAVLEKKMPSWDFPSGPVVKNLPCNAGEMSSIPGWGTKIPHPCMPQ